MPIGDALYRASLFARSVFRRHALEDDLDDELRFHVESRIVELTAAGRTPADARRAALREIEGLEHCKEECRDMRRIAPLENFARDLKIGLRVLRRSPSFTAIALLTLTLGIGANTAIFSVVNAVLLRPLPYPDAGRIVRVYGTNTTIQSNKDSVSAPDYFDWRAQSHSFTRMCAMRSEPFTITGDASPEFAFGQRFSPCMLNMLGIKPAVGRDFAPDEDQPGRDHVALIGHDLWMRRFAGDRTVIGREIHLNFEPYTIIGVLPAGFRAPTQFSSDPAEFVLPLVYSPVELARRGEHNLQVYAALKPGVTPSRAQADMDAVTAQLATVNAADRNRGARVSPLLDEVVGNYRASLRIIFAAAGLILLISCANLANALLARGVGQQREIAVRLALGAGRGSILRQLLVQNLLLSGAGCAAGILAAFWILKLLDNLGGRSIPRLAEVALDAPTLVFAAAVSLLTGLAFGLLPAIHLSRSLSAGAIKSRGAGSATPQLLRWRDALVIAQVTLSIVLLVGAGLLLRSFARLRGIDIGFLPSRTLAMKILLPKSRYPEQAKRIEFYDRLAERVSRLPGIESVGYTTQLPLRGGWGGSFGVEAPDVPMGANDDSDFQIVSPGYFTTLRIRLLRGRFFTPSDRLDSQPVVIVNGAFARRYWPKSDPIGQHLTKNGAVRYTVVGVVDDVHLAGPAKPANIEIYFASGQAAPLPVAPGDFVARSAGDPLRLTPAIQRELWSLDREQPITAVQTMDNVLSESTASSRFNMLLLVFFASLALVLAAVGIYGVVSYSVAQRSAELGLRMAIGARPADILSMVLRRIALLIGTGALIGLAAALALNRYAATILFQVKPYDPASFAIAVTALAAAGLAAALVPALRAVRIDPMAVLRVD